MSEDDPDQVRKEFDRAVNMTPKEVEHWLGTEESKAVGQKPGGSGSSGGSGESVGHHMGGRIVELLQTKGGDLSEGDVKDMRKVVGYVHRHIEQGPSKSDVETSKWRYSLMNWGHDPLKKG